MRSYIIARMLSSLDGRINGSFLAAGLLVERLDVGTAGFTVGYQGPSQFSREYSRYFGVAPTRDIGASA